MLSIWVYPKDCCALWWILFQSIFIITPEITSIWELVTTCCLTSKHLQITINCKTVPNNINFIIHIHNYLEFSCLICVQNFHVGMTLTNQNDIHDEMKSRLNSGNACYHSVQNLFCLPVSHQKKLKIKIYRSVI
jgi:hypothetical protein